jgi:sulfur-carrier protein adenylyltransferase/sulfurtransferase
MNNTEFLPGELERYNRHIILPQFGLQGQQKLKAARVLIVGSGGLGSPLVLYLAAAGVGTIGIIDFDTVSESNLQRQILFDTEDLGKLKAQTATEKIKALNPYVNVITYNEKLTSTNALEIIKAYDVVADGTDNFPTRYLVNDACVLSGKAYVYGSVFQFEGQVAVFNYKNADGSFGPNYRDLFPSPPPPELIPDCASGGVLGVLPGIIGSMQALEIIKLLTGIGENLNGKFLVFDALGSSAKIFAIKPNPDNPLNGANPSLKSLIDYEEFCNAQPIQHIKEIRAEQFLELRSKGENLQLIDVREPVEYEVMNIEGKLIPLKNILERVSEIEHDKKVIIHCQSGSRSKTAINLLQQQFNFDNLYNLTGGIEAVLKISNIVKDRDKK